MRYFTNMSKRIIKITKTKAAALANLTLHRKTRFKSKAEIITKQKKKEAKKEINEYKW